MHPLEFKVRDFLRSLEMESRLQKSTVNLYEIELRELMRLLESPDDIHGLRTYLGMKSTATYQRKLIMWRKFLKTCESPWKESLDQLKIPKLRQKEPIFLSEEEVERLEEACASLRDKVFIQLALRLGLRLSEMLALKFSDIEGGFLRISRKGGREQRLPLGPELEDLLGYWEIERGCLRKDRILVSLQGDPLSKSGLQGILKELAAKARIEKKFSPHSLRHTFATHLASKGAPLPALKEILGHSKISTTERYLHVTPEHLRSALALAQGRSKTTNQWRP